MDGKTTPGRNVPCPCGSGKKYKKCCYPTLQSQATSRAGTTLLNGLGSTHPPPAVLYKYTALAYAEAMVNEGQFFVNTLSTFRAMEECDPERGDSEEGTKSEYATVDHYESGQLSGQGPSGLPPFAADNFFRNIKYGTVKLDNAKFVQRHSVDDCYVYCLSEEFSVEQMRRFKCDACVKISNPLAFFHALSACLTRHASITSGCMAPCLYQDREEHYTKATMIYPAQLKSVRYAQQKEHRAIWEPEKLPISSKVITCSEARQFCTLHHPPSPNQRRGV